MVSSSRDATPKFSLHPHPRSCMHLAHRHRGRTKKKSKYLLYEWRPTAFTHKEFDERGGWVAVSSLYHVLQREEAAAIHAQRDARREGQSATCRGPKEGEAVACDAGLCGGALEHLDGIRVAREVVVCRALEAIGGEAQTRLWQCGWGDGDFENITGYIQLREGLSHAFGLDDDFADKLATGKVEIEHFEGIHSLYVALRNYTAIFKANHETQISTYSRSRVPPWSL